MFDDCFLVNFCLPCEWKKKHVIFHQKCQSLLPHFRKVSRRDIYPVGLDLYRKVWIVLYLVHELNLLWHVISVTSIECLVEGPLALLRVPDTLAQHLPVGLAKFWLGGLLRVANSGSLDAKFRSY